jgi:membrane protease YdiL (CAAX protease family)
MSGLLIRAWDRWFAGPLGKVEAESLAYRQSPAGRGLDRKTISVVLTAAACLTVQNYTGSPGAMAENIETAAGLVGAGGAVRGVCATLDRWSADQGTRLVWFALNAAATYTVLPAVVVLVVFREKLTDYGVGVRGVAADWPVYLAFAAVMVPLVYLCSALPRFQDVYPFYRVASPAEVGAGLVRWELAYALQFVALEFFFRGFLVHGTKHRFGAYAVFLMVIPYCMIHFHKPFAECVGSILAGVGLGVVSLVTKSVWPGAGLHVLVAWGMDVSVLARRGLLA